MARIVLVTPGPLGSESGPRFGVVPTAGGELEITAVRLPRFLRSLPFFFGPRDDDVGFGRARIEGQSAFCPLRGLGMAAVRVLGLSDGEGEGRVGRIRLERAHAGLGRNSPGRRSDRGPVTRLVVVRGGESGGRDGIHGILCFGGGGGPTGRIGHGPFRRR